ITTTLRIIWIMRTAESHCAAKVFLRCLSHLTRLPLARGLSIISIPDICSLDGIITYNATPVDILQRLNRHLCSAVRLFVTIWTQNDEVARRVTFQQVT